MWIHRCGVTIKSCMGMRNAKLNSDYPWYGEENGIWMGFPGALYLQVLLKLGWVYCYYYIVSVSSLPEKTS